MGVGRGVGMGVGMGSGGRQVATWRVIWVYSAVLLVTHFQSASVLMDRMHGILVGCADALRVRLVFICKIKI